MRIAFYTLGCKVNQLESWSLADAFSDMGHVIVDFMEEADIYIINTCAVTARAASQSRQMIRRLRREHPGAGMIATGCYIQTSPPEIMELAGEMLLVGNSGKQTIGAMLDGHPDALKGCEIKDISLKNRIDLCLLRKPRSRTRGYLKIQDGCNAFCSYCIVPYTRGRSRSLEMDRVMMQVERYRENDVKEIIVTGIHAGYYGRDLDPPADLMTLLQKLCATFRDIRFRLSSIEPTEITEEMVAWASETENFCPHWHIPLQSGSDAILSRMNRKYDSNRFLEVTSNIRKKMPDAAIGADVMAGFPGETEKDFMATMELVKASPVTYLHVFPYSPRKGTRAADMGPRLDGKEKKRRAAAIRRAGEEKRYAFYRSQEHTTHQCLVEQLEAETGRWKGFTENYLPVLLENNNPDIELANEMIEIQVINTEKNRCLGVITWDKRQSNKTTY